MSMQVVPFDGGVEEFHQPFNDLTYLEPGDTQPIPGRVQGVYITTHPDTAEPLAAILERWFATRPEVDVVDYGTSDKQHLGFVLLEWSECAIDRMFIDILNGEASVGDYTLYGRDL